MMLHKMKSTIGTVMEYYYTILLLGSLLTTLILLILKPKQPKQGIPPPGPKPWPIIGNLHHLGTKPHRSLTELSRRFGPLMRINLGSVTTIVISSSKIAKQMFLTHDLALSNRIAPESLRIVHHDKYSIGWLPVCPKWRNLRKILTIQLLTNKELDAKQGIRQSKVEELIDYVRVCCERGQSFDFGKAMFVTLVNMLSGVFFSMNLASYSDSTRFQELLVVLWEEGCKPNISDVFPMIRWLDLQGLGRKLGGCFNETMAIFEGIIDQRLRDSMGCGDYDDVLANLLKLVEAHELSLDDVKHLLMDMFLAGTDTTATTLEWAMTELLRHPQKMTKAQIEIDQVCGKDEPITESHVPKLPYIEAIVKESLRLYPPAPFLLPHKAENDVNLCGYLVPKNAQVWVNVWSIGRDPSVWANPNSFESERFLGTNMDAKSRDFEFLPFGEGRRICPGIPLAYRMAHLMLANLLHSFNWKASDGGKPKDVDVEEKFGITLQRLHPLEVFPLSR